MFKSINKIYNIPVNNDLETGLPKRKGCVGSKLTKILFFIFVSVWCSYPWRGQCRTDRHGHSVQHLMAKCSITSSNAFYFWWCPCCCFRSRSQTWLLMRRQVVFLQVVLVSLRWWFSFTMASEEFTLDCDLR